MGVRVVRLGSPRQVSEGVRIGTVRRPPRGVPKARFATDDRYDVWYSHLSPTPGLMKLAQAESDRAASARVWGQFTFLFRRALAASEAARTLDLLAALSHQASFSLGCDCADEARCHR